MKNFKKGMLMLTLALTVGAYSSMAQIYVKIRPARPHYERIVAPSPRHVWIEEEWEPRGATYVFVGGHWVEPPQHGRRWIPGHWKDTPHGAYWKPGHWK